MIYSPDGLMRYNNGKIAIVDDIPLLSQWIKKDKSFDLSFLVGEDGLRVRAPNKQSTGLFVSPAGDRRCPHLNLSFHKKIHPVGIRRGDFSGFSESI